MSSSDDTAFWTRVDRFIDLANQESREGGPGAVSASLLFAAARHNAFATAITAQDPAHLRANIDQAIEHNVERYRRMLAENLNEYAENFASYIQDQRKG